MKFKMPSSYQIAGVTHTVVFTKNLGANDARRGTASYFDRVTEIDPSQALEEQRRTLIHEALHHIDDLFATDLKENQIKRLSTGVAELI